MSDNKIKVLFVDDEDELRKACDRLLTNRGYFTQTAENGQVALEMMSQNLFDVVILDLKMPIMDGDQALDIIRLKYPNIPVIIITGHGTIHNAIECMKKGAYDILTKPFDIDHLSYTIKRAIEKRNLEQQTRKYQDEVMRSLFDLNTEKKRLETIINGMANGIMVTDPDFNVTLHNTALLRLTGKSPGDLKSPCPVADLIPDPSFIETLQKIQRGQFIEDEFVSHEIRLNSHFLRTLSAPALAPDKNVFWSISGTITVVEDISAFKELDQMKSDFMNMVAHELRSPLVAIRQINTTISEGLAGPLGEKQKDFVDRVTRKIDTLLDLVNDLLEMARVEAGKYHQAFEPTDMAKIIEEVVNLNRPRAEKQGLTLTYSCKDLPLIQADPKNMEKVMNNLLSNAINYSPGGGQITINTQKHDGEIEITVRDNGVGIPVEELPKIFNRFYRVKHPKTRHVTGTGLGLSIVKGIIEAHHGTIEVSSFIDKGTIFRILLPTGF